MTAPLCLYLHSQIQNIGKARQSHKPHFPKFPQEQTQLYEQQNRQKSWLHQQSDESNFQEETSFEIGSWITTGSHENIQTESEECWLEGTFEGHLAQPPPQSRAKANTR